MARPSEYSPEVVDAICDRMVNGQGLLKICADDEMPARVTVYRWLASNPEFRKRFAEAREALMDFYAEQILNIAFDESGDVILDQGKDGKTSAVANHAKVQRDRLKVDSLKWTASRLFPKRYGDKMELLAQDEPKDLTVRWEIKREIVSAHEKALDELDGPADAKEEVRRPAEPPPQITYQPAPPPADLTPEAWARITRVSDLIEQIAPSDEMPEAVFGIIEAALRRHYLGAASAE